MRRPRLPRPRLPRPRLPRPHLTRPRLPRPRLPNIPRPHIPLYLIELRHVLIGLAVLAVVGAAVAALIVFEPFEESGEETIAPAPQVSGGDEPKQPQSAEAAEELGFPAFATKNTTRVGGADPAADAAGVALATFPSAGGSDPPDAVTLVGTEDWPGGVAASVLVADPVRAPILVSSSEGLPAITEAALAALDPQGGAESDGAQIFAVGTASAPSEARVTRVAGDNPAEVAAAIDRLRSALLDEPPDHLVVASQDEPAYAMPAAAWAARSGDPVLFTSKERLPAATVAALKTHTAVPVYVLGPPSVISSDVIRQISDLKLEVRRVSGEDPVTNAIEFARYADGTFGWNINDPGHGFVVASADRPLDAAAAAPLSASGKWGPLLLTDAPDTVPSALRGYLLDLKPGYQDDPTRAVYNHIWVIGDQEAIDVNQQAAIDDLAEVTSIRVGPEGEPEEEAKPDDDAGAGTDSGAGPDSDGGGDRDSGTAQGAP